MSTVLEVTGGAALQGRIVPQGAKNEALQVIAATLLTREAVTIHNIPNIADVNLMIDILRELGVDIKQHDSHQYTFQARDIDFEYLRSESFRKKSSRLRGIVLLAGPLLARMGKAIMASPGGDKIGRRRLDTHLLGLQRLGVTFQYRDFYYELHSSGLKGNYVLLDEPSVTGTANLIMAAVCAKGTTTLYHAACEPYVQQLCRMLVRMGARIQGIGSNLLTIEGVNELGGCTHHILPDMIEIGSFIGMAAMTGGEIRICHAGVAHLGQIPDKFRQLGIELIIEQDDIFVPRQAHYQVRHFLDGSIPTIYDHPWPGFTPDLLSIMLVVATQARGSVLIHQKMFESRLFFVDKLIDMGARIILCDPHRAVVIGLDHEYPLRAITMTSPDIRAGVALLIAALSAEGTSTIYNVEQIDRGYEAIDQRLQALGAHIRRIEIS